MTELADIAFTLNGSDMSVAADPRTPSVYVLRNDLGLNGVRVGCAEGQCGVCMVLIDGVPQRSCEVAIDGLKGRDVVTVEGLGTPQAPHPIQAAILEFQAAQCGYCLTGIMITASVLKQGCSEDEARQALSAHLCRCGTHSRILPAVLAATAAGPSDR